MARLKPVARIALRRKAFKKPIKDYLAGDIEWNHSSLTQVKGLVRSLLRIEQDEICPYCQRLIIPERRNVTEHIEHFLDKSRPEYRKFGFNALNLLLACQGCNIEKGTRNLVDPAKPTPVYLTVAETPFLWPHPYFDDMTACVQKRPGPVYSPIEGSDREAEAARLIKDLKLNDIQNIERRHGQLSERMTRLVRILGRLARINDERSRLRMVSLNLALERVLEDLS